MKLTADAVNPRFSPMLTFCVLICETSESASASAAENFGDFCSATV